MGQHRTRFVARGIPRANWLRPVLLEFIGIENNTYLFRQDKSIHEMEEERRNQSLSEYMIAIHEGKAEINKMNVGKTSTMTTNEIN